MKLNVLKYVLIFGLILVGCNKEDIKPELPDISVVDISKESDWNYWVVGKSDYYYIKTENSKPKTVLFHSSEANKDYSIFFTNDGIPEKVAVDGYIFILKNFNGSKVDVGIINPIGEIEILRDIETGYDWNNLSVKNAKSVEEWSDVIRWTGRAVGALPCIISIAATGSTLGISTALMLWTCGNYILKLSSDIVKNEFDIQNGITDFVDFYGNITLADNCNNPDLTSCFASLAAKGLSLTADELEKIENQRKEDVQATVESLIYGGVHIAGIGSTNSGVQIAKYWKNGKATNLSDGTKNAYALSLTVNGSDIYVAGYEEKVAKYWKNGVATNLSDGSKKTYANSIAVSGNDIYVAGQEQIIENNIFLKGSVAKYWKNGVVSNLSDGTKMAYATSIAVSGNDVFVSGSEGNLGKEIAKYWKNGISANLTDPILAAKTTSIAISGSDIYVVGWVQIGNNPQVAKYWKNGIESNLTDGTFTAQASAITISGNDVYISGQEKNSSGKYVAKYWKNGTAISLTNGSLNAFTTSIFINGSDVYVAGYEYDNSGWPNGRYWKNGIANNLSDGIAQSIFVK